MQRGDPTGNITHDDVIKLKHFPHCWPFVGNSPVTGEFPWQRPVTRSFDVFFDLRLNKRLSKQSWVWWFESPSRSLYDVIVMCKWAELFQWRNQDFRVHRDNIFKNHWAYGSAHAGRRDRGLKCVMWLIRKSVKLFDTANWPFTCASVKHKLLLGYVAIKAGPVNALRPRQNGHRVEIHFSWMEMYEFRFKFLWSLFQLVQ